MESELLILDVIQEGKGGQGAPCVRLVTRSYPSDARGFVLLARECQGIEQLERAISQLKGRLDILLGEGRALFRKHQTEMEVTLQSIPKTPQEIWRKMERAGSLDGMREHFNPLPLETRKEVADYIFTNVNIFKGAASLFSQHFNEEACLVE
ncbi:MAG TPA: hypothetical protein VES58_08260 [Syntrophobacteria bacterium]|nr:hypothetical protein [Syntrophobacteria bacterium]